MSTQQSKTPWTPGPWELEAMINQEVDLRCKYGTFLGLNPGSGAPDKLEDDDYAEFEANARLISKAPELVEALEFMVANIGQPDCLETHYEFNKARALLQQIREGK